MMDVCSLFAEEKGLFLTAKRVFTVFVWNSRSPVVTQTDCKCRFSFLQEYSTTLRCDNGFRSTMQNLCGSKRKFFRAGKIEGMCESQKVWMEIVDRQLFPIISYGCRLWDLERTDVKRMINMALRKGVRRRLGIKRNEPICDRFGVHFKNQWKE